MGQAIMKEDLRIPDHRVQNEKFDRGYDDVEWDDYLPETEEWFIKERNDRHPHRR